ncbi:hypothetical protein Pst134EA_009009 [Puccinia striiformis f. sp. tritici]|uniref:hypothetical protein n=1 Tax=Puccinia striiformis f. sp. tritici TaxID=168172 RepID=UPI0020081979|nr:hypothetical protein Pst134EA_009009 [Puccinia striiformis f. sp. tritici]XP_047807920.1 hypothetical protein Pst134EA_009009 [Puccinia striiformis f. sp. tritici]KAH9468465.1 hypothetical protein Pst134EA_009009 [Puccinia striiformis f. sp. tritici]KAH9468466.1 hypothetical protein Pst134EA_009009 [Puccinia striiformis f. sp. tritici]
MISLHKLLLVTLFCAATHSQGTPAPAQAPTSEQSSTSGDIPLYQKRFTWPNLPYQADTGNGPRGTQQGYNKCNATTQNQDSMCQTTFINSIQEFCLWGASKPDSIVGNIEGEMVAYCTTKKFGTRLIPAGAITGLQVTRTPGYIQAVGFIQQTALNLQANDTGGEEDPHGADQRGNPLGALMYSSAFNTPGGPAYTQVIEWSYFIGAGVFCYKACDPAGPNAAQLCQHIYDRIGCTYNAPAHYETINGTFTSCQGENQLPAGTYVEAGVTKTYTQPPESLGPITSIPYKAFIPAVSNCQTFTDTKALWPDLPQLTPVSNSSNTTSGKGSNASTSGKGFSSSSSGSSSNAAGGAASGATAVMLSSATLMGCVLLATMMTL